ncbi:MAG: amino acid permease [Flavobacteriaceae bacterium]|nr:amino acid permease [Flavobacteriaceae bacterium]
MRKRTQIILTLLLLLQIVGLYFLRSAPTFVEKYYSTGIYPYLAKTARYLFGWVPFSVGDVFYVLIALLAIRWLYRNVRRLWFEPLSFLLDITAAVSVVYFMFHVLWGLNYYRQPLHESIGIDYTYTTEELITTTKRLIAKSNALHRALGYADSTKIDLPYTQSEIFEKADDGYQALEATFPKLAYSPNSIKKSGWSLGLTYMGYSGYYNPFSGEAQVNNLIKTYKFPVVSCHEMAHQIGYAAENEANFIATLATINNSDPYIQYAGYIFALRYCVNEIARRDIETYEALLPTINFGILESYREMREFWTSYENPFEVFSKHFYNYFLKANNQSKGIMSYSYMVALVVNYFEERPF